MKRRYAILLCLPFIIYSCERPKACFEASKGSVKLGEAVDFTNCSSNSDSYVWKVGNAESFITPDFTYEFFVSGEWIVELSAMNADGKQRNSTSKIINVLPALRKEVVGSWKQFKRVNYSGKESFADDIWTFFADSTAIINGKAAEWSFANDLINVFYSNDPFETYQVIKVFDGELGLWNKSFSGAQYYFRPQ